MHAELWYGGSELLVLQVVLAGCIACGRTSWQGWWAHAL